MPLKQKKAIKLEVDYNVIISRSNGTIEPPPTQEQPQSSGSLQVHTAPVTVATSRGSTVQSAQRPSNSADNTQASGDPLAEETSTTQASMSHPLNAEQNEKSDVEAKNEDCGPDEEEGNSADEDEDEIEAKYADGDIETGQTSRATGRVRDYHNNYQTSRRTRK